MPDLTTLKVPKALRERITADAAGERKTVHQFLEGVLDDYERAQRLSSVAAAYAETAATGDLASWLAETREWEAVDATGEQA